MTDIAALRDLMEKATRGPWAVHPAVAQIDAFATGEPLPVCQMLWPTDERTEAETEANAALIVAAINALPELLADAERYRWLRDRTGTTNRLPHVAQYPKQEHDRADYIQVWDRDGYHPDRLDAAIDTAMRSAK